MSERFRNMLIRHEGLRLRPYRCTAGKLTIGIGRNLDDVGISKAEAFVLFENDIAKVRAQAAETFPWFAKLDPVRQDVVLDMIFNLGLDGFKKFKLTIAAIEGGRYDYAATRMLQSLWAKQVGRRATELAAMMRTGNY